MKRTLTILLLGGCNAVEKISGNANEIRQEARLLVDHGRGVSDEFVVTTATKIDLLAAGIHDQLPSVEARVPEWLSTIQWSLIAFVLLAVCFILWQTGIGRAIKSVLGWIPKSVINDAELAVSVLDENRPESAREYFAARRADPVFNDAFKKARAKAIKRGNNDPG